MSVIIRIVSSADGNDTIFDGMYVCAFDPDAHEGFGLLATSPTRKDAKKFDDIKEAHAFWQKQSTVRPLRDDGRPNRPLTAYTVEMIQS